MRTKNLFFPALIGLVSFVAAFKIFVTLNSSAAASGIPFGTLSQEKTNLCIQSNHQPSPFGSVIQTVESDKSGIMVNLDGQLKLSLGSQILSPNITINFSFNPLGQLIGAYFKINNEGRTITLGLLEVNPIKVLIKVESKEKNFQYEFKIPGPIEIKKVDKKHYALFGSVLDMIHKQGEDGKTFLSTIPITLEERTSCGELQPIQLDPYMMQAKNFLKTAPQVNFFPFSSPEMLP